MDQKLFKITYNASLFRVKADFSLGTTAELAEPPAEAMTKAQAKIESLKVAGQIACYRVYPERLTKIWERARSMGVPKGLEGHMFSVTLAAGSPELPGLNVSKPTIDRTVCNISIQAPRETVMSWRIEWLKLIVRREMERHGIKGIVCPAMLQGVLLRAQAGETIKDYPLGHMASGDKLPGQEDKIFSLVWNKGRKEVAAVIYEVKPLFDQDQVKALLNSITVAGQKAVQSAGVPLRVLRTEFLASLEAAKSGPEFFGVDLPLVQLVVTGVPIPQQSAVSNPSRVGQAAPRPAGPPATGARPAAPVQPSMPGQPQVAKPTFATRSTRPEDQMGANRAMLPILVTRDKMQAKIGDFPTANYDRFPGLDGKWLRQEIARQGVVFGIRDEFLKAMEDALAMRQPLSGMWVAVGEAGTGGKEPYLQAAVKAEAADEDKVDMRSQQNTAIVKRGQLLATICYKIPAVPGKDVKGEQTPPPPGEELAVTASEGVEAKGLKFFATADGIPVVDPAGSISMSRSMLHEGDVNLATGNIHFDGPVEIKGSVDTGAEVFATGDIIIKGDVRGGRVRALGSITVEGSITTGDSGLVKAGGAIQAEFIQNSVAFCGGDLIVKKNILASKLTVMGGIQCLDADSLISGGRIRCSQYIKVGNLGQPKGNPTELSVGVDPIVEDRIIRLQKRLERVTKKNDDDRGNLRELVRKKDAQMTQRHAQMKAELQERVQRGSALVEKLKKRIEGLSTQRGYNPDARIYVAGRCVSNCKLTMAGNIIPMVNDLAGVVILAKKWSGSYIASIEDWMAKEAKDDAGFKRAG